ncbi:MAG: polymerase IV protein [Parcubacteria group bacterium GW2011_GWA2_51_10]|nr:MAG: polymerase IV protein [Parcubacteria group bacterium GW2011_GWA2_51_10]
MWGISHSFPRAILHIDGDSFFASCEVAKNPALRGKPVVTGKERGIASSMTYEAKRMGVKRGMMLSEIRRVCPSVVILPSDYETYSLFSNRMYEIVRRYTPAVEEYSIDECFADLSGMRRVHRMGYRNIAEHIKQDLERELGMTFSIGLSATKVLAKIGSKWKKPDGLTAISLKDVRAYLEKTPVEKIWGVGPNTAAYLNTYGIRTAWEFAKREEVWVKAMLSKPFIEIWHELNGEVMNELDVEGRQTHLSISKTKTFTPPSRNPEFVYSQLSKNIENACIKLRRWDLVASEIVFFLKTQEFKYHACEIKLPFPSSVPHDILKATGEHFPKIFHKNILYRATGITMMKLIDGGGGQLDLFGSVAKSEGLKRIFESVDEISGRYGKHTVFLGTSFQAMRNGAHAGDRGHAAERTQDLFKGETTRRRLGLPMLGEV